MACQIEIHNVNSITAKTRKIKVGCATVYVRRLYVQTSDGPVEIAFFSDHEGALEVEDG